MQKTLEESDQYEKNNRHSESHENVPGSRKLIPMISEKHVGKLLPHQFSGSHRVRAHLPGIFAPGHAEQGGPKR